ncbi:hypothetical protein KR038_009596 [Drosophila bunnanda]|nr:hypothetical protein KR038_009596 [Drosophila bunnanda]
MKTRQLQTTSTSMASYRSKQWVPTGPGMPCERERKHEMAAREREEQVKRDRAMAAAAAAAQRVRQHRMVGADRNQAPNRGRTAAGALRHRLGSGMGRVYGGRPTATVQKAGSETTTTEQEHRTQEISEESSMNPQDPKVSSDLKADRLKIQLEELTQLPEQQFEQGFRQWLDQEGIAREMHSHLRAELINCFNNTALGQLLNKAAGLQMAQSHALLTSPLAMALPTLVAEFLHSQNCHFTLSVFCSEIPHRHTLPKFQNRPEFRFRADELQQVLSAVLGGGDQELQPDPEFNRLVEGHYEEDLAGQTQSLLMALVRSLVETKRLAICREEQQGATEKSEKVERKQEQMKKTLTDCASQTEPAACLEARPEVDTSRLYQTEEQELILGADGRSVFVGPRVSQSLHAVEQQMADLIKNLRLLTKSCAPPVEVISEESFEQLLKKELRERERLTKAGQTFNPGEPVIKLPEKPPKKKVKPSEEDEVVNSEMGPIILPAGEVELPRVLPLHPEQFSSLAVIRQSLDNAQRKTRQPQARMYVSVQRMETLMSDVSGCVQLLGNVLNLSMEQEHAVGQQKGFKEGYLEGFGHGHFMGVQEGRLREQHDRSKNRKEASTQVQVEQSAKSRATQTSRKRTTPKSHMLIQTDAKSMGDATTQVYMELKMPQRTYEQWIHEMLHSASGQMFLERVELSLNKALKLQKQRLDELYLVKLRHQAEMLRLTRRQNSWRTMCRRVERDSHVSAETQELVQKIFRLLEHYETHHHLLVEKIQQTELAAEQATCIVPMWTGQESTPAVEAPPASAVRVDLVNPSSSPEVSQPLQPSHPVQLPVPLPAPALEALPRSTNSSLMPHPYPGLTYQLVAVAPSSGISVPTAYIPVDPRLASTYRYYRSSDSSDPVDAIGAGALSARTNNHARKSILPKSDVESPKDPSVCSPEALPGANAAPPVPTKYPSGDKANVPPANSAVSAPAPGPSQQLKETPHEPSTPVKPHVHDVATNTIEPAPPQPILSLGQSSQGPSFDEALLSAKNRMKQLEEESDLLEQSFLSYLEKTKATTPSPSGNQKSNKEPRKPHRIPATSQLRDQHEQLDRTLDSFMVQHRSICQEDATLREEELQNQPPMLDSKLSSPLWLSEVEEAQDQHRYQFTNAISEARKKLLGEISLEKEVPEMEHQEQQAERLRPSGDWMPAERPKVLSVVRPTELTDITPSRSSSNDEMRLLLRRAKDALGLRSPNPLLDSSSDSSSLADPSLRATRSPSQKLQQSMAKMELLFGGPLVPSKAKTSAQKPSKQTRSAARPLSAPTTGAQNVSAVPPRPHTAPTLYPIQEAQQSPGLHLGISGSTSTSTSTSQSSLPRVRSPGGSFQELVDSAVLGPDTTPEVSFSQEFWKRMNL